MAMIDLQDEENREKATVDMTPMIDIVFLLLVYFVLTMTFMPDEKWLSQLLPTTKGGDSNVVEQLEVQEINISFYPSGAPATSSTSELQNWYDNLDSIQHVTCRINGSTIELPFHLDHEQQVERIHAFINEQLAKYEDHLSTREKQDSVNVHCFSRLPWRYAIAGFDAVRAYEKEITKVDEKIMGRDFGFAPNQLRDHRHDQLGDEIFRLRSLK